MDYGWVFETEALHLSPDEGPVALVEVQDLGKGVVLSLLQVIFQKGLGQLGFHEKL